jgi:tRNA (Thr-GGU) A37 N-methylase
MFTVMPIGHVSSSLVDREHAPKQGNEGAPEAWLNFKPEFQEGLRDLRVGAEILVLTWLDRAHRDVLSVHPRDDQNAPLPCVACSVLGRRTGRTQWGSIACGSSRL